MVENEISRLTDTDNGVLFQTLAETTSAAIFIVLEKKILYANPSAQAITGYSLENLHHMEFWQLVAPGYQEAIQQNGIENIWDKETPTRFELKLNTQSGEDRWVDVTVSQILMDSTEAILITAFDITDRDKAERILKTDRDELEAEINERNQALLDVNQRLQTVLRALPVAVWITDADGRIIEKNNMADKVWGKKPNSGIAGIGGVNAWWADSGKPVHSEEWGLSRAIRNGETSTSEVIDIRRFDGKPGTLLTSSAPIYDSNGQRVGAVMVQQDITNQRQLERQGTRRANEMNAILEAMVEAVIVYGADGIPQWANPAATSLLGFNPIGPQDQQNQIIMYSDKLEEIPRDKLPITRALYGEEVNRERLRIRKPNTDIRVMLVSANPLKSERGVSGAVVVMNDVTEQVFQQERVEQASERAQALAKLSRAFAGAGLDLPEVLETIAQQISDLSQDTCIICINDEDKQCLQLASLYHPDSVALTALRSVVQGKCLNHNNCIAGSVFQSGEAMLIRNIPVDGPDTLIHPAVHGWLEQYPISGGLFIPMIAQGRKLGVMSLLRRSGASPYSLDDQLFFQNLAERAALAIESATLYAQETSRSRELEALHRATTAMLTTLDLDTLLSQILDAAQHAIPAAEQGSLHLIERETGQLAVRAAQVFHDLRIQKVSFSRIEGHVARAVVERKPFLIHDNLINPIQPAHASMEVDTASARLARSAIIAPLILGEKVLGVLSLIHSQPGKFTLKDMRLLVSFAATATAAIQNATLYAEVQRLATTDTLTGLLNRRRFFELGALEMDRLRRFNHPLSAIMLDVDNLKHTNDTFGHATGDRLLQSMADRCRATIRRVDILGRYGGDEFAILLPETTLEKAVEVAERIRCSINSDAVWTEQGQIVPSASIGVAVAVSEDQTINELLARADEALYRAKQNGRNRVEKI